MTWRENTNMMLYFTRSNKINTYEKWNFNNKNIRSTSEVATLKKKKKIFVKFLCLAASLV